MAELASLSKDELAQRLLEAHATIQRLQRPAVQFIPVPTTTEEMGILERLRSAQKEARELVRSQFAGVRVWV